MSFDMLIPGKGDAVQLKNSAEHVDYESFTDVYYLVLDIEKLKFVYDMF